MNQAHPPPPCSCELYFTEKRNPGQGWDLNPGVLAQALLLSLVLILPALHWVCCGEGLSLSRTLGLTSSDRLAQTRMPHAFCLFICLIIIH